MRSGMDRRRFVSLVSGIVALTLFLQVIVLAIVEPQLVYAGDNAWTRIGPWGGTVYVVAPSPDYAVDHTLFAGTEGGGVFVSNDGGASWQASNAGLPYTSILALAVSPSFATDHTVFAGTGDAGIFKSTNGGASWSAANTGLLSMRVQAIAVSPGYGTDGTVFAGTGGNPAGGIFKSTDQGQTWIPRNDGLISRGIRALAISPGFASDATVFAGIESTSTAEGGVYKTTNGGDRWRSANVGLPENPTVTAVALAPGFPADPVLYAGTYGSGVFKSTNQARTWVPASVGLNHPLSLLIWGMAMSPDYAADDTLYIGTYEAGVYKTTNAADRWRHVGPAREDIRCVALPADYGASGVVFAAGVSGVFKSPDRAGGWSHSNQGLSSFEVSGILVTSDYATDGIIVAGRGVRPGTVAKSTDEGSTWSATTGVEANYTRSLAIAQASASDPLMLCGTDLGAFKSTTLGDSWTDVTWPPSLGSSNMQAVAVGGVQHFFAATSQVVYRSTTAGGSWQTSGPGTGTGNIRCLAVSPNYGVDGILLLGTLYDPNFGTSGGIWVSGNRGVSWQPAKDGLPLYPLVHVVAFSPDFAQDRTVFAGLSHPGGSGGVYKSTDAATTWQPVNSGIAFDPVVGPDVRALAVSPNFATDRTVYAGTHGFGVFRSTDGGASWQPLQDGLYDPYITVLSAPQATRPTVLAGTRAGGIWHFAEGLPNQPPTNGTTTPSSGGAPAGQIVYFTTTWSDPNGHADLKACRLHIGRVAAPKSLIGNAVLVYQAQTNKIMIRNNAGTRWWGGKPVGSDNVVQNDQAKVYCNLTTVSRSGNTITVHWAVEFKPAFQGATKMYLKARDVAGLTSNLEQKGTWTVQ